VTFLPRARFARERMDEDDADIQTLQAALHHVAAVNRWLGARRALLRHLDWALPSGTTTVLDVGTGSADLPLALARWASHRARPLRILAAEPHPATLDVARQRIGASPAIRLLRADGLRLPFRDGAVHLALLSMTLHHMDGGDLVNLLRELARVAAGGRVLVGELERSIPAYLGALALAATVWRRNPITRHDGPLSVRRAFTPAELRDLAHQAGLRQPTVHRHPVFRLVLRAHA
jgi:ubiquinone/menaquinone biosynthesis C-methylase UbiE